MTSCDSSKRELKDGEVEGLVGGTFLVVMTTRF